MTSFKGWDYRKPPPSSLPLPNPTLGELPTQKGVRVHEYLSSLVKPRTSLSSQHEAHQDGEQSGPTLPPLTQETGDPQAPLRAQGKKFVSRLVQSRASPATRVPHTPATQVSIRSQGHMPIPVHTRIINVPVPRPYETQAAQEIDQNEVYVFPVEHTRMLFRYGTKGQPFTIKFPNVLLMAELYERLCASDPVAKIHLQLSSDRHCQWPLHQDDMDSNTGSTVLQRVDRAFSQYGH